MFADQKLVHGALAVPTIFQNVEPILRRQLLRSILQPMLSSVFDILVVAIVLLAVIYELLLCLFESGQE